MKADRGHPGNRKKGLDAGRGTLGGAVLEGLPAVLIKNSRGKDESGAVGMEIEPREESRGRRGGFHEAGKPEEAGRILGGTAPPRNGR